MKKKTIKEIKPAIESFDGYKLISEEYIGAHSKLKILHSCGNIFKMSWNGFSIGHRCPKCSHGKRYLCQTLSYETVKKRIESVKGYKLISIEYINSRSKLEIMCSVGDVFLMKLNHFTEGSRCPKCYFRNNIGENNGNWNPNLTDEEREHDRNCPENREWVKAVFDRDGHTCQKCLVRGGELEAHHILPYALFPKYRVNVENGITLCKGCHKRYHFLYGKGLGCNLETLSDHLYSYTRYPSENENRFIENHQHLNNKDVNS